MTFSSADDDDEDHGIDEWRRKLRGSGLKLDGIEETNC